MVQCPLFTRSWLFSFFPVYCMHSTLICTVYLQMYAPTLIVAEPLLPIVQLPAMDFFACLVLLLLVSQSGAAWDLSWVRPGIFQSCNSTKLQVALTVLSPVKLLLISRAWLDKWHLINFAIFHWVEGSHYPCLLSKERNYTKGWMLGVGIIGVWDFGRCLQRGSIPRLRI